MRPATPFIYAAYHYQPAYGWHQQLDNIELPPQIKLQPPIDTRLYKGIDTVAKARNGYRNCLWFAAWHSTPLPDVFFEVITGEQGKDLACFYQPVPGHKCPFFLVLYRVDEHFPSVKQAGFWAMVRTHLNTLPPLLTDETTTRLPDLHPHS
ncbi:hypothetical protein [Spirosoma fluminis]